MPDRFSHRDRRIAREVHRSLWAMVALVFGLGAVAIAAPVTAVRFGAVVGLAAAGAATLVESRRLIDAYLADLHALEAGRPLPPAAHVEMRTNVGLERATVGPSRRSPNTRRRGPSDGAPVRSGSALVLRP